MYGNSSRRVDNFNTTSLCSSRRNTHLPFGRLKRLRSPPPPLTTWEQACEYVWGSPIQSHAFLARGDFDVVICSDLLYDPVGWEPLLSSLRQLAASAKGVGGAEPAVYLAHRTRNAQEHGFFAMLREGRGDADGNEGWSWSCRGLSGGGGEQQPQSQQQQQREEGGEEKHVGGGRREDHREGGGVGGGCSEQGSVECAREGERLSWRRGCFPDVALYELSPIRVGGGKAHTKGPASPTSTA